MERKFLDWHPADIIAALHKKKTTLAAVSRAAGLSSSTLGGVLKNPWPRGEKILAEALGTEPWIIWPSRYHDPDTHEFIDRTKLIRKR
ncbi:DNA-binding transcriptional regulator SfsB [Cronobacter muytjensii]|uniref:DNA-binding transcriptional regulator SfsB n=1 Tax=Cronobacter muytjensii TaxID=413501 RepID=UPI002DB90DDD|nr:DNA-binding transcriptional regulator SfsB [Cronobacter muytjensii]MEB8638644.1 DNA-binding transcriptional regulator SfsB [Cronobacter muytjensii]